MTAHTTASGSDADDWLLKVIDEYRRRVAPSIISSYAQRSAMACYSLACELGLINCAMPKEDDALAHAIIDRLLPAIKNLKAARPDAAAHSKELQGLRVEINLLRVREQDDKKGWLYLRDVADILGLPEGIDLRDSVAMAVRAVIEARESFRNAANARADMIQSLRRDVEKMMASISERDTVRKYPEEA